MASPTDPQKEIEALRKENADRRAKAKPFLEAFDGWNETQQSYMLGVIQMLGQDGHREAGYRELLELAKAGVQAYDGPTDEPEQEVEPVSDTPNTINDEFDRKVAEEVARQVKERETEMAEEASRRATNVEIDAEARALGYEPGSSKFAQLMHHASRIPEGETLSIRESLAQAHTNVLSDIAELLGQVEPEAEPEPEPAPAPAPALSADDRPLFAPTARAGGSGAPVEHPNEQTPKTFAEARVAFENLLDNQSDQPVG